MMKAVCSVLCGLFLLVQSDAHTHELEIATSPTIKGTIVGKWVTPAEDLQDGYSSADLGAWAVAKRYSGDHKAVGIAIYVTTGVKKETAETYGKGLVNIFAKEDIPADYYLQWHGEGEPGTAFHLFVHGYGVGIFGAADIKDGITLATDGFNGEEYVLEMLRNGEL